MRSTFAWCSVVFAGKKRTQNQLLHCISTHFPKSHVPIAPCRSDRLASFGYLLHFGQNYTSSSCYTSYLLSHQNARLYSFRHAVPQMTCATSFHLLISPSVSLSSIWPAGILDSASWRSHFDCGQLHVHIGSTFSSHPSQGHRRMDIANQVGAKTRRWPVWVPDQYATHPKLFCEFGSCWWVMNSNSKIELFVFF